MDRCESYNGNGAPLSAEVTAGMFREKVTTEVVSYVYGLGGRDFRVEDAALVFNEIKDVVENGKKVDQYRYIGLRSKEA